MFAFPNSSAMDATASSGGPSTFLPQIVTGQPAQIAQHATGLLGKATQFLSMLDQFTKAAEQLKTVWSGQASQSAAQQITGSLQAFENIIKVTQNVSKLLGVSGTLVQSAQTAYTSVVGSVNPTVASLMSNPWTYSAAVALSTATSASLRAFIMAIEGLLQALGVGQLGAELATLVGIASQIEQLANGGGAAAASVPTTGSVPTTQTISTTPITAPQAPPPVATTTGQQAAQNGITNYTPPALQGFGSPTTGGSVPTTGTVPTTGANGSTPSIDPSNSWIAVDPASTTTSPATAPMPAPAPDTGTHLTGGEQVTVTDADGVTTTVAVPQGQTADVTVNADGSVTVTS